MPYWKYDRRRRAWAVADRGRFVCFCPKCGHALQRVHRRLVDRLFSPGRYRFQCQSRACRWAGNLLIEGANPTLSVLLHGLVTASIVFILFGLAFGLSAIHRERVASTEAIATPGENPYTTPLVTVDDSAKPDGAASGGVTAADAAVARQGGEHQERRN